VHTEGRRLLIANSRRQRIEVYRYNSCDDVRYISALDLPARMSKITAVTIDRKERLWVGTGVFDSLFDANLFYWESNVWQPLLERK
jgi:hypothetical protein